MLKNKDFRDYEPAVSHSRIHTVQTCIDILNHSWERAKALTHLTSYHIVAKPENSLETLSEKRCLVSYK